MKTPLEQRISELSEEEAVEMMMRLMYASFARPNIFLHEGHDDEQLKWFEKTLKEIQKSA